MSATTENKWLVAIDSSRSIAIYYVYTYPIMLDNFIEKLSYEEPIEQYYTLDQRIHENLLFEWGRDWVLLKEKGLIRLLYSPQPY